MPDIIQKSAGTRTELVFGLLLSAFMAAIFAGLMPLMAFGFTVEWLYAWATGFLVGWPLGFVVVSVVNKPLMRLAARLTR